VICCSGAAELLRLTIPASLHGEHKLDRARHAAASSPSAAFSISAATAAQVFDFIHSANSEAGA
jgi:hypothetical protein